MDTSSRWREPSPPGEYVVDCVDPGNLLNEGLMTVDVGVVSLGAPKLLRTPASTTPFPSTSRIRARGIPRKGLFTGQWQGVVRPLLEWTTEER